MTDYGYLTHYLKQSFGWVKVAEYALTSAEDAKCIEDDLRARHPNDEVRFDLRVRANH